MTSTMFIVAVPLASVPTRAGADHAHDGQGGLGLAR